MDRIRRTLLFIPGNNPAMLQSADVFEADSVIIDLEDAVSINEKDSARILVREVLNNLEFKNSEIIIRINPFDTEDYRLDLDVIMDLNIDTILLPKASIESIRDLDKVLKENNKDIKILVLIETALGVENIMNILSHSDRCVGLMLGGEDLCVDLGCKRTKEGTEILYARGRLVNAAKALNKIVIDTPFTDVNDEEGLITDTKFAKQLGFNGKAVINPRQIQFIHNVFNPSLEEIRHAERVISAKLSAEADGKGVFSIDGKMVDLPIIKRAEKVLLIAKKLGLGESYED